MLHFPGCQSKRDASLDRFRKAEAGVLLCTDVAARGLDFPDIDSILQVHSAPTAQISCQSVCRIWSIAFLAHCMSSMDAYGMVTTKWEVQSITSTSLRRAGGGFSMPSMSPVLFIPCPSR